MSTEAMRAAAQQALEALEALDALNDQINKIDSFNKPGLPRPQRAYEAAVREYRLRWPLVMSAVRAALAQREDEPVAAIEPSVEMVAAYLDANRAYWQRIDSEPGKIGKWRNGTPEEATAYSLRAALAATPAAPAYVPLSEIEVAQAYEKATGFALTHRLDVSQHLTRTDSMAFARAIESLVVARMRGEGK